MATGSREALIRQLARKYNLDPNAVDAIGNVEGSNALHGGNSIGDNGTSFGFAQLHAGGALPAAVWARGPAYANKWANSRAGIEYTLQRMSSVAGGLRGRAAVQAISSRFERPADVPGEVSKALGFYGKGGGDVLSQMSGGGEQPRSNPLAPDPKAIIVQTLLQASSDAAQGKEPDFGGILQIAQARQQQQAAQDQFGPTSPTGPLRPAKGDGVALDKGLWGGASLQGENGAFIGKVQAAALFAGATHIRATSGRRTEAHNVAVGGAPDSNHLTGHALDGEGFVPGKGWVPLGTLLAPVASKFGLRSGATFQWGGKPDVVHVDDAFNQPKA